MTKWWKCDLQLATPAWKFSVPGDTAYDLATQDGKGAFAARYIDELISKGIEVIVLADHNTSDWIDLMIEAAAGKGVVVFPGCEITTGSGADGIHMIIIGERDKTARDFDLLLAGPLGFDHDHVRYHDHAGVLVPGSSGKTILQILDDLPDDYLAIAPHALNDNGIASGNTAKGDIRWKAIHHPRLEAVDPGDCLNCEGNSFNDLFRRRALDYFPRLKDLAFVSTSDSYDFETFGSRFCWIRMEEPTLEALRQAFLDHEARIICSWDPRLEEFPELNPNRVRHSWITRVLLAGSLGNSTVPLAIDFHSGLNVIIGGRGSGKSTVVAALRQIYSGFSTLPEMVRQEAEVFSERNFDMALLSSVHRIQNSQEERQATWSKEAESQTLAGENSFVPTDFKVRVVNQKELFERVSHDRHDPLSASRSFLSFVDESLGLLKLEPQLPDSWSRRFDDASAEWRSATREHERLKEDLSQLPSVRAKIHDLEAQIAAFDAPEAKARREHNEARFAERDALAEREAAVRQFMKAIVSHCEESSTLEFRSSSPGEFQELLRELEQNLRNMRAAIWDAAREGTRLTDEWRQKVDRSEWKRSLDLAEADDRNYLEELGAKGINPEAYSQLKGEMGRQQTLEKSLAAQETNLAPVRNRADQTWEGIQLLLQERRSIRGHLLSDVSSRSGRLRFELQTHRDYIGWSNVIRDLLNLRADAFLDDVPDLAKWIWNPNDDATRESRWFMWRTALSSGDFGELAARENANLRSTWQRRLETLDETVRLRLATEIADDIALISFLKDGGRQDREDDWQDITHGSPGQRTAAMVGFVLHHGDEPLILDQPEDDLDTEWISNLVVRELRASRWKRQIIVVTHNANIPVNGDAERVIVLENEGGALRVRETAVRVSGMDTRVLHCGAIELKLVREDIQNIMEGGIRAFIQRERKYNNEVRTITAANT